MPDTSAVDVAIIGAGPVGLFAAFYAGMRQMSVKIVDSLEALGGQLVTLYPEKYIYDVAGFPKVLAKDLAKNLIEQGLQYGATTHLGEQVLQIAFDASTRTFTLMTKKALHQAKSVLIATGIGAFQPKTLPLPNAAQLLDRGLHYFVREIAAFAGQRILIVGGGDSAVDWANMLSPIAAECTLIHRRDAFRAHEDSVAKMLAGKTKVMFFYELDSLEDDERVQCAVIYDNRSKTKQTLEIDHGYGNMTTDLLPGRYDVLISGATLGNVEVRSKCDSQIPVGVLRVNAGKDTAVAILDAAGKKQLTQFYGPNDVGLPAGKYNILVSGQTAPVEVKTNEVTNF